MSRPWHIWVAFGLCLTVVLAAMGWLSLALLRLEGEQVQLRCQALLEENVRLSLWRMDSALAGIVATENARPYFSYSAFYGPERAYNKMFAELAPREVLLPGPLLAQVPPFVLLHFQFAHKGRLSSPQVPKGNMLDLAEGRYTTPEKIESFARRLTKLQKIVSRETLAAALQDEEFAPPQTPPPVAQMPIQEQPEIVSAQIMRNTAEWQARTTSQQASLENVRLSNVLPRRRPVARMVMKPVWVQDTLLLVRKVKADGQAYIQGCWLDWPALRRWLLSSIRDLLPGADIVPVKSEAPDIQSRSCAALPVRLLPGHTPGLPADAASPIRLSLIVAWVCVLLGAGAVALLLSGTIRLSERRWAFVSAVTHELRTPLTTFRMYTEMLSEEMVPPEKRGHYLQKLCAEADRLGHLVENVLAYARLERGSAQRRVHSVRLQELLDGMTGRLSEHARHAGMELAVDADSGTLSTRVKTDTGAVEQILFNLIDNACKYAAPVTDSPLHLEARRGDGFVLLKVRDHGPGVSQPLRRGLFRAFGKSASRAARSAPGVGLGLALSRRLARQMGARLYLDKTVRDGACFVLALPLG